jgi:hypothetical protein
MLAQGFLSRRKFGIRRAAAYAQVQDAKFSVVSVRTRIQSGATA